MAASGSWTGDPLSLLNQYGYPQAMPSGAGTTWTSQQLYIYGAASDVWVLDWDGTATMALTTNGWTSGSMSSNTINSNRIEYTLSGSPNYTSGGVRYPALLMTLTISAITTPPTKIRLYRKEYESLINGSGATSYFDPNFLTRIQGFGYLRFMDWLRTNATRIVRWADRHTLNDLSWTNLKQNGAWSVGTATGDNTNLYTSSVSFPTLTDGQPLLYYMAARPKQLTVSSVTRGNPTTIQFTTAHNLSNGDKITYDNGSSGIGGTWGTVLTTLTNAGLPPDYTVTVTASDTVTIPLDSSAFTAPTVTNFFFHPEIRLTDGTTTKRCIRTGISNFFNSEWGAGRSYPSRFAAVYDGNFDAFIVNGGNGGDGSSDLFYCGMPIEAIVALCNYLGAHPHICIPTMARADYSTQCATYVRDNLDSGLVPIFEYSNEVWNTGFTQTGYATADAVRRYGSSYNSFSNGYPILASQMADAVTAVFGGSRSYINGFALQGAGGWSDTRARGPSVWNGNDNTFCMKKFDVVFFAPYFAGPWASSSLGAVAPAYGANSPVPYTLTNAISDYLLGGASKEKAFNWLLQEYDAPTDATFITANGVRQPLSWWTGGTFAGTSGYSTVYTGQINAHLTQMANYPSRTGGTGTLKYWCYEGMVGANANSNGVGFPSGGVTQAQAQQFWLDFLESRQAANLMTRYCRRMLALNIVPSLYTAASVWSTGQNWGAWHLSTNPKTDGQTMQHKTAQLVSQKKRRFDVVAS